MKRKEFLRGLYDFLDVKVVPYMSDLEPQEKLHVRSQEVEGYYNRDTKTVALAPSAGLFIALHELAHAIHYKLYPDILTDNAEAKERIANVTATLVLKRLGLKDMTYNHTKNSTVRFHITATEIYLHKVKENIAFLKETYKDDPVMYESYYKGLSITKVYDVTLKITDHIFQAADWIIAKHVTE